MVLKFFMVEYDQNDPSHQTFVEGLNQEKIKTKFLHTGVPKFVDIQPSLPFLEPKPTSSQEIVRKYAPTNMKVVFQPKSIKICSPLISQDIAVTF